MPAMTDQDLSPAQVDLLTRAMLSVALVDGIHPAEAALIGQFYEGARSADMPSTAAVLASAENTAFDVQSLKSDSADFADTLVRMCLMTAYADGGLSPAERQHVEAMASRLGVDAARFDNHLAVVRDELVGALAHLPDAASVAKVVGKLNAAQ